MIASLLAPIFKSMLLSLLTKAFLQDFVIHTLEAAAEETDNEVDDKIIADIKKAWGVD